MGTTHKNVPVIHASLLALAAICLAVQAGMVYRSRAEVLPAMPPDVLTVATTEAVTPAQPLDPRRIADYLVLAVIQVESGGDPRKVGHSGERGIMQIKRDTWMETTRRVLGRALPFDRAFSPEINRCVGRAYLAELQRFLQENRHLWCADERSLLLACYNAGPNRVMEARFDLRRLPASTQSYVERATALHDFFLASDAARVRRLLMAQASVQRLAAGS